MDERMKDSNIIKDSNAYSEEIEPESENERDNKESTSKKSEAKRKKSGNEYRKLKKIKERESTAVSCNKVTDFFKKKSQCLITQSQAPVQDNQKPGPSSDLVECETLLELSEDLECGDSGTKLFSVVNDNHENEEFKTCLEENKGKEEGVLQSDSHGLVLGGDIFSTQGATESEHKEKFDLFKAPNKKDLDFFFSKHPIVPSSEEFAKNNLPFPRTIFFIEGEDIDRRWLTYNSFDKRLYCSVCLAYGSGSSVFCTGFNDWKHTKQRINEHENSKSHGESAQAFVMLKTEKNVEWLLFQKQLNKRQSEVLERRSVIMAIIEVIKVIGKQGLALRNKSEAAYNLNDPTQNHGNFLEILLLLAQYDQNLSAHIKKVCEKSGKSLMKRREKGQKKFGRGQTVTFLSKTTVMNIVDLLASEIKIEIANEIKQARIFSIMMDTTLDVSTYDQCSLVARYLFNGVVHERVIALKHVISTSGANLFETLKSSLSDLGLSIENCVADSFDGASNMRGIYKGVSAKLTQVNPNHIHTWCYAHVLNLVITDIVQCSNVCISFFGLLQETQTFLKDSQKRLAVYLEQNPSVRLEAIGETRWRSKSNATTKIFGHFHYWSDSKETKQKTSKPVYIELITTLSLISNSNDFNAKVRNDANCILQKLCSFQTIVVAMTFLVIFQHTTPLSDYLQTKDLDYVQAWRLVSCTLEHLKGARSKFADVLKAAEVFVTEMTNKIEHLSDTVPNLEDIIIETKLPEVRCRKRKKMPGETSSGDVIEDSNHRFEVTIFNCIIDQVVNSMKERFSSNQSLYFDLEYFDPKRFNSIEIDINSSSFQRIIELVPDCDEGKLKEELISFSSAWHQLSKPVNTKEPTDDFEGELSEEELVSNLKDDEDRDPNDLQSIQCKSGKKCNTCFKCAFDVLLEYNMYSRLYMNLFKVYKYLLTLPVTQVSCERSFSKLKYIKTRLRSRLTDEHLESLFLMNTERDILVKINNEKIIDKLSEKSEQLRRLLHV